jgi:hypothetical protein
MGVNDSLDALTIIDVSRRYKIDRKIIFRQHGSGSARNFFIFSFIAGSASRAFIHSREVVISPTSMNVPLSFSTIL